MKTDIFQAIADPTRRAIISLVLLQPMTPNALAENFSMTRQAVSKHIQVLQDCGLVKARQEGRERFYTIQPKKLKVVADWLEPFRLMWESRFDQLDKVLAQQTNRLKSNSKRIKK